MTRHTTNTAVAEHLEAHTKTKAAKAVVPRVTPEVVFGSTPSQSYTLNWTTHYHIMDDIAVFCAPHHVLH